MLDNDLTHMTLGPKENLPCPLHDDLSLEKAENEGDLWFMPPTWHLRPGVSKGNVGSGGNPRTGNALGILNRNKITKKIRTKLRYCQEYCKQREILDSSQDEKITSTPVTVVVCASFLGGFGNGNVYTVLNILRQLETELNMKIRIVLLAIVMGTLEPTDKETAARNQEMLLRQLDSCIVGQYKDIQNTSPTMRLLCDSLLLFSNANNFGETDSIDKVICHASNYVFGLFHTTLGNQVLERIVDIEETWPDDENGGKLWASTAAITKIHLDVPRVINCVGFKLLDIFFDGILIDNHIEKSHKEANSVCAEQMLSEQSTKDLACQRLLRSEGNNSVHAVEDTIRLFHDRRGNSGGFQACCDFANASRYILNTHIQRNVNPTVERQAPMIVKKVEEAIHNMVISFLQRTDGLSFSRQFLEKISDNIVKYNETNAKKLNIANARKKSIDDRLATGHSLLKKLQCRNPILRFFSFAAKKNCRDIFRLQTEQAIKTNLEIKARTLLANDFYPLILESAGKKIKAIQKACEKALEIKNDIKDNIKRLEEFSPILQVPIGLELADQELINTKFNFTVEEEGGSEKIFMNIFSQFEGKFHNLSAFNQVSGDDIQKFLIDHCCGIALRRLDSLNVIDTLEQYAPTNSDKGRLIDQAICESSGSIRTTGEGGRIIPTIKFIGAGNSHRIMWLEKMTNNIDKTEGQWKSFETGDKNTIVFWQQRAQLSVARILKWTSTLWNKPENIEEIVNIGPCPILAFAPTSSDDQSQIKTIAAMALINNEKPTSGTNENSYFNSHLILNSLDSNEILLKLQNDLPLRTDIYRKFVISITNNYKQTVGKLKDFNKSCSHHNEGLFGKLGQESFNNAVKIANALYPHLSRLPEDVRKYLKNEKFS